MILSSSAIIGIVPSPQMTPTRSAPRQSTHLLKRSASDVYSNRLNTIEAKIIETIPTSDQTNFNVGTGE